MEQQIKDTGDELEQLRQELAGAAAKNEELLAELARTNGELERSSGLKSNFLANMSHEIRTPMNVILGMAEMAMRAGDLPDQERGYIQQIKDAGVSLLSIIDDVLDFSKIDAGRLELNEHMYSIFSLINDMTNLVMTKIGDKDITLIIEADPKIPFALFGDDIRIKQVLFNFATNAVKFTQQGFVKIVFSFERSTGGVELSASVRDSGIGIKSEDIGGLFGSFEQLDSRRNRNIEGMGLGLAISRELVRMMGGEVSVTSVYGEGSEFSFKVPQKIVTDTPGVAVKAKSAVVTASYIRNPYIWESFSSAISDFNVKNTRCKSLTELVFAARGGADFVFIDHSIYSEEPGVVMEARRYSQVVIITNPRRDIVANTSLHCLRMPVYSLNMAAVLNREADGGRDEQSSAAKFRFEAPGANILIVDDNAINLTVAKGLLGPLRMNIETATSAREAIELIDIRRYDMVLMDHMMPEIDGVQATHMLREKEGDYYKNLPILALTANAINNAREMFLSEGMNDFIAKPIEISDISAKIKKWLPPEKIVALAGIRAPEPEVEDAPLVIENINVNTGLAYSGSMELYLKILSDYASVIEKKSDQIEQDVAQGDIKAYTIEVHTLKSSSRLIGARELSELAAELEKCGHDGDFEPIREKTPELLRQYRAYIDILAPYRREETREDTTISLEQLNEKLSVLYTALDDFDINTANSIMDELSSCKLDGKSTEIRVTLRDAVNEVQYESAMLITDEWREHIQSAM